MTERKLSIDPSKLAEYQGLLGQKFEEWHQEEYRLLSPEYFKAITEDSFLAYLQFIVNAAGVDGEVDLDTLEKSLQAQSPDYFSPPKFLKAIDFIQDNQWEYL